MEPINKILSLFFLLRRKNASVLHSVGKKKEEDRRDIPSSAAKDDGIFSSYNIHDKQVYSFLIKIQFRRHPFCCYGSNYDYVSQPEDNEAVQVKDMACIQKPSLRIS